MNCLLFKKKSETLLTRFLPGPASIKDFTQHKGGNARESNHTLVFIIHFTLNKLFDA